MNTQCRNFLDCNQFETEKAIGKQPSNNYGKQMYDIQISSILNVYDWSANSIVTLKLVVRNRNQFQNFCGDFIISVSCNFCLAVCYFVIRKCTGKELSFSFV